MTQISGGRIVAALGFNIPRTVQHNQNTVGRSIMRCRYQEAVLMNLITSSHFIGKIIEGKATTIQTGIAPSKSRKAVRNQFKFGNDV
jgi:hypothetical protein